MAFGKQMGSVQAVKNSAKGGGNSKMAFIPSDKALVVRFLEEPENWIMYQEVYDPMRKNSYPVPDDPSMPGYDDDLRKSDRYLANVVDVDRDLVKALKLPKSVVNALIARYEKYGTLTDRDYELYRTGSGLDTEYFADPEAPSKKKLDKYDVMDLEEVLVEAYEAVFGAQAESSDNTVRTVSSAPQPTRKPPSRQELVEEDDDDEYDDDDDDELDDDDDDEEVVSRDPDDIHDVDDDEYPYYELTELVEMPPGDRRKIAKDWGIVFPKALKSPKQQAQMIMDAQEDAF